MGGSVRRRGSRWEYRYDAGLDPLTGRRSRPGRSGFPTFAAAQQALHQAQQVHAGGATGGTAAVLQQREAGVGLSVLVYLTAWLTRVQPGLRPATANAYGRYIASHIGPVIGNLPLHDLTTGHLNQLYVHLLRDGHARRDGRLSPKTVVNIHRMLHQALSAAIQEGAVSPGVLDHAEPPPVPRTRAERTGATSEAVALDRAAAEVVADQIFRKVDGRKMDADMFAERSREAKSPPTRSRFRRSAGPSTSSGGGI